MKRTDTAISLFEEFEAVSAGDFVPRREKISRARSIVGDSGGNRAQGDFYPTPPAAVVSLLEKEQLVGTVWEPACGDGAISRVLIARGHQVISTDLFDRGVGVSGVDFLTVRKVVDNVVTNPPYALALPFARHALECVRDGGRVAMLLKLQFLEGVERRAFFEKHPPRSVYVFSKRLTIYRDGEPTKNNGMITYAWFVWTKGWRGKPTLDWI